MAGKFKIFILLLKKNFLIRKRYWFLSIIIQIGCSIAFFLLGNLLRVNNDSTSEKISSNHYKIVNETQLLESFSKFTVIRYTPYNNVTRKIMEKTRNCLKLEFDHVQGSQTEDIMITELQNDQLKRRAMKKDLIGIIFYSTNDTLPKKFNYKMRTFSPIPTELFSMQKSSDDGNHGFYQMGIPQIQICLDKSYITTIVPNQVDTLKISIQPMPYPSNTEQDTYAVVIDEAFSKFIYLIFIIVACLEIVFPANEKVVGINVLMSVNGVKNYFNLLSWLISGLLCSTFYLIPIAVMLKYLTLLSIKPFLLFGNALLVWIALFSHLSHIINYGYHVSAYFKKGTFGVMTSVVIMILMTVAESRISKSTGERFLLYLGIIFPNFIYSKIFEEVIRYEKQTIGANWNNFFTPGEIEASVESSIGMMVVFSVLGSLLHFLLTLYIYNLRPGKYGVRRSLFHCFQCTQCNKIDDDIINNRFKTNESNSKDFEPVTSTSFLPGIQIRNLQKRYDLNLLNKSTVYALRGVSMDFYKSQITALLGHNGAGKTTLLSILSGLTDASEGLVVIDGKNIQTNPEAISKNIGLCPQENMVFPDLNVYQQLMFFGTLKGNNKPKQQLEREIDILLAKVNLVEKRNSYPQQLSGGQKRRLCLAMAVIGDANVLILDEPTSGMDAESKREVWDIVLKMRGEKTIIISTHDMEEADILGDRIAIMHTGKLKCYGTSMFLKKLYGNGQVEVTLSIESWCDVSRVITEMGVSADILSRDEGKIVLAIPRVNHLPLALDKLEISKKQLGITGISVSMITLEQVFLRVTRDEKDEVDGVETIMPFRKVTGLPYFIQTFFAFFVKRIIFARKNPLTCLISLILPCLSFISILLQYGLPTYIVEPTSLTLNLYSNAEAFVYAQIPWIDQMYKHRVKCHGGTIGILRGSLTNTLIDYANQDPKNYLNKVIISAEFNKTKNQIEANGLYSESALFSIPITINYLSNALIKTFANNSFSIEASLQSLSEVEEARDMPILPSLSNSLILIIFLTPAVAMYITQPSVEIVSGIKHLQLMTGASKFNYWVTTFLFDFMQYSLSILILLTAYVVTDIMLGTHIYYFYELFIFTSLMLLFGASVLPFIYLISFFKRTPSATINILTLAPVILSIVQIVLVGIFLVISDETYKIFHDILTSLFLLIPHISFFFGYFSFYYALYDNARCRRMPNRFQETTCMNFDACCRLQCYDGICQNPNSYFAENKFVPSLEICMIYLASTSIIFFIIIFILEKKLFIDVLRRIKWRNLPIDTTGMDELVLKEKNIVDDEISKLVKNRSNQQFESENILLVQGLKKNYGSFEAVRGTSFRVKEGECFGLLGVNGAGKSTSFKMLTGASIPTSGTMYLKQLNIANDRVKYLAEMGYCPQQDAIIDTLNTWDHLNLFACLRGIPRAQIKSVVKKWVTKLNLTACAAQPSGTYSGGNKRRLNIALALIGNPSLVLMDEPTTGVDPAARRSLWNTLKTCQDAGQSIILTSHSMEECEVLCNRLVIMVRGRLVCVGASQELKQRFGAGYNIHIKLIPDRGNSEIPRIKYRIESILNCKLIDENSGFIGYHVTDPQTTWTKMYSVMNELKNNYDCIDDFMVLSSTLEQLFIQFARAPHF